VLVKHFQSTQGTALATLLWGPMWSVEAQLLATIADALHVANWQRIGKRSAQKPKPIPRPWEAPKSQAFGKDPIPVTKFDDWWEDAKSKRKRKPAPNRRRRRAAERKKPPTA
jgi:hypothetical protein